MSELLRLLRPSQWTKNLLVFGALFFSGEIVHGQALLSTAVVFVVFCLITSAAYIFNDWRDMEADRATPGKSSRPLAAGTVSPTQALVTTLVLYAAAIGIGLAAGFHAPLWLLLGAYVVINLGYSLGLKQVPVLELFCVASGFIIRFFAGAAEMGVSPSPWIISATAIGALLVVSAKRRAELARGVGGDVRRSLRGYNLTFLDSVVTGLTAGTLVMYLLFCVSDYAEGRYGQRVLFSAIFVAMGLLRFQQIVFVEGRGEQPTELLSDGFLVATLIGFLLMFAWFLYL